MSAAVSIGPQKRARVDGWAALDTAPGGGRVLPPALRELLLMKCATAEQLERAKSIAVTRNAAERAEAKARAHHAAAERRAWQAHRHLESASRWGDIAVAGFLKLSGMK